MPDYVDLVLQQKIVAHASASAAKQAAKIINMPAMSLGLICLIDLLLQILSLC